MGIEDLIREKHSFRERLKEFLSIACTMTTDELEIALGRLADMLNLSTADAEKSNIRIKGATLKQYFDLRTSGEKSQSTLKRTLLIRKKNKWCEERGWSAYRKAQSKWDAEYASIKERAKNLPILKRLFIKPPPDTPYPLVFIEKEKNIGMHEFLIAQIAEYQLVSTETSEQNVSIDEIKLIAP